MGQDSRKAKRDRKNRITQKVRGRLVAQTNRQHLRDTLQRLVNTQFALLAVLQSVGGSVTVAKEDAVVVQEGFTALQWRVEAQEDGSLRIVMRDSRTVATALPAASEAPSASDGNIPLAPRTEMVSPENGR